MIDLAELLNESPDFANMEKANIAMEPPVKPITTKRLLPTMSMRPDASIIPGI
jgi:hypothetical protein